MFLRASERVVPWCTIILWILRHGLVFVPPRDLEQPGFPAARPPEALAKPAHVAPGGLELLLAHRRDRGRGDGRVSPWPWGPPPWPLLFPGPEAPKGGEQPNKAPAASCATCSTQSWTTLQRQLTFTSTIEDLLRPDTNLV